MCGIFGILKIGVEDLGGAVNAGLDALAHRGPDDRGLWTLRPPPAPVVEPRSLAQGDFSLALGHVRLSIFDLSDAGHQPMIDDDGRVIVHNGEIYNFLELREDLQRLGHRFHSRSDTEVILAAYRQWGPECVHRFIGMWAFAIRDGATLFLSRDRLGKKPLYIREDKAGGMFAFASEARALRHAADLPWRPDELTVFRYLAFAEMEQDGRTFYEGVREFGAGCSLVFDARAFARREMEPEPRETRYWSIPRETVDVGEREAIKTTADLLIDGVRLRLRSDAPLGLSLSGGLDSTMILGLAVQLGHTDIETFSTGYGEKGYDEQVFIDHAVKRLPCRAHRARSGVTEYRGGVDRFARLLDAPSRLPGPWSQWRVAHLASQNVKVLLDGQGADELAGGYMYFLPVALRERGLMLRPLEAMDLARTIWNNRHVFRQYKPALVLERIRGKPSKHKDGTALDSDIPLPSLFASMFAGEQPSWANNRSGLNTALHAALTDKSLPALLRYGDRVNMAFGVENRCPFLDHRLVEYVAALPAQLKVRGGTTKWVFRRVAKGRIPERILRRRLKMGFPTPFGVWLQGELRGAAARRLDEANRSARYSRWVDTTRALALLDEHADGKRDHQALLWRLLALAAWESAGKFD